MKKSLKVKVCGLCQTENINAIAKLDIDFIGFIFYKKSPRYVEVFPSDLIVENTVKKVGVWVNATKNEIIEKSQKYNLHIAQLHGDESPDFCRELKNEGLEVWKAVSVGESGDFEKTRDYTTIVDFFLFDTATALKGGSGKKFDWELLHEYTYKTPFFLSGGIDENSIEAIKNIKHPLFIGVDLNSKFEISPGLKNINLLTEFTKNIKI